MSNAEVLLLLIGATNLTAFLYAYPKAMARRAARLRLRRRAAPVSSVVPAPASAPALALAAPPVDVRYYVFVTGPTTSNRPASPRVPLGLPLDPGMLAALKTTLS